jgi:hypothetical protein
MAAPLAICTEEEQRNVILEEGHHDVLLNVI